MQSTPLIAFNQHAATTVAAVLLRFVTRVQRESGPVRCCYEAGPCGFELHRALTAAGIACDVIAPECGP